MNLKGTILKDFQMVTRRTELPLCGAVCRKDAQFGDLCVKHKSIGKPNPSMGGKCHFPIGDNWWEHRYYSFLCGRSCKEGSTFCDQCMYAPDFEERYVKYSSRYDCTPVWKIEDFNLSIEAVEVIVS